MSDRYQTRYATGRACPELNEVRTNVRFRDPGPHSELLALAFGIPDFPHRILHATRLLTHYAAHKNALWTFGSVRYGKVVQFGVLTLLPLLTVLPLSLVQYTRHFVPVQIMIAVLLIGTLLASSGIHVR